LALKNKEYGFFSYSSKKVFEHFICTEQNIDICSVTIWANAITPQKTLSFYS